MKEELEAILKYRLQQAKESVNEAEILFKGGGEEKVTGKFFPHFFLRI